MKLSNVCFVIVIFVTTAAICRSRQKHRACAVHYHASCAQQLPSDNASFFGLPCLSILMDNTLSYLLIHEYINNNNIIINFNNNRKTYYKYLIVY